MVIASGTQGVRAEFAVNNRTSASNKDDETLDWQAELLEIAEPLLFSLKALTEKPRTRDRLRTRTQLQADNLGLIDEALANLKGTAEAKLRPGVAVRVATSLNGKAQTLLATAPVVRIRALGTD